MSVQEWNWMNKLKNKKMIQFKTPGHYDNGQQYDIIDVCNHYSLSFNRGNVLKYIARAGKKGNELEDLHKALDYLQREIEYVKSRGKL
jgi:hypothetical protein